MEFSEERARYAAERFNGLPFAKLLGMRLTDINPNEATVEIAMRDDLRQPSGVLHGGIVATLLDTACGYASTWCRKPGHVRWVLALTLTVHFTGQAGSGVLTTTAWLRGGGRRIVMASAEVRDEAGNLIGFGDGVARYRSGSEDPDGIPYEPPGG